MTNSVYTVRHKGGIFFFQPNFIASLFQSKLTMAFMVHITTLLYYSVSYAHLTVIFLLIISPNGLVS